MILMLGSDVLISIRETSGVDPSLDGDDVAVPGRLPDSSTERSILFIDGIVSEALDRATLSVT